MSTKFIGRKEELQTLNRLYKRGSASLVVVKGRRRIGKSRLIEEFAKGHRFFRFAGIPPTKEATIESQLRVFAIQLSKQIGDQGFYADDWSKLFSRLSKETATGRVIILFDEISWMGSKDPDFLGKLKDAWDTELKQNPELLLILCGSVSTWIDKNIISSTGYLGRIAFTLTLEELPLAECNQFWLNKSKYISPYEKLKVLSVTGGVPNYLEQIDPMLTAEENIRNLCFIKGGPLVHEFDLIFSDLFSHRAPIYKKIVEALAQGSMEIKEISETSGLAQTGAVSEYLDDLVQSGFLSRDYTWHIESGEISKFSHFRLSDNYIRFYLKYMDKILPKIDKNDFAHKSTSALPAWDTIMGLQFENLVLRNRKYIQECLRINPDYIVTDNPFFQRKTQRIPGCQIDYLIQTTHASLYVCEFKFSKYRVGKNIIPEMQKKIARLVYPKSYSIRPVLIHVNGVHEEVEGSGFFTEIIDFGSLLKNDK